MFYSWPFVQSLFLKMPSLLYESSRQPTKTRITTMFGCLQPKFQSSFVMEVELRLTLIALLHWLFADYGQRGQIRAPHHQKVTMQMANQVFKITRPSQPRMRERERRKKKRPRILFISRSVRFVTHTQRDGRMGSLVLNRPALSIPGTQLVLNPHAPDWEKARVGVGDTHLAQTFLSLSLDRSINKFRLRHRFDKGKMDHSMIINSPPFQVKLTSKRTT